VLVATKLHVPDVRPGFVPRNALVGKLADDHCRLALVCAPAGWGKSVLLTQWHAAQPQTPFAWVSLDPGDDDPVRFWSYVVAAIRTVVPGFGGAVLAALPNAGPSLVEIVIPRLINELALLEAPVVLVLDDYHLLNDEVVQASVAYLLRHLPRTLRLAIATRADPPLPLARLRAAGELVEIRAQELQFHDAEAELLLNGTLELGLEAADVHRLQERTEGWPAGLQLAALSLRGRSDRAAFIRSLAGDDRQIGDYLHEVVEDAPRPLREFLLRTSILERMCAPLCDAVTGSNDGAALLAEAFRSNLFVVALDDRGYWFRYHHLLRELLRSELARAEPEFIPGLHARAAAWHQDNGNVDEAIEHAIAAGRIDQATALIAEHWLQAWDANPFTVARWLQALPPEAFEADGRLWLVQGWAAVFTGRLDAVEPAIAAAERTPRPGPPVDILGTLETKAAFLRGVLAYLHGDVGGAHAQAKAARDGAAPMSDGLSSMLIGLTAFLAGDHEGALEPLEHCRATLSGLGWVQALLTTHGVLATIKAESVPAVAERRAADAERLMDEYGLAEAPTASIPVAARGILLERKGDLDGADAAYARAATLAGRAHFLLDHAHALLLGAALKRRRRDYAGARELAREARGALAQCKDPGALADLLARTERSLGGQGEAASPADGELSEREIAVLRLLATDLSQREIGAELYVSFNTVKTHTRTVFRKLGVSSREDAVARGRELGLL
jgi:LuxR family maltose regulon positive regulatory protein